MLISAYKINYKTDLLNLSKVEGLLSKSNRLSVCCCYSAFRYSYIIFGPLSEFQELVH